MSSKCSSCFRPIRWAQTESGKLMPIDAEPRDDGNLVIVPSVDGTTPRVLVAKGPRKLGEERYVSHFVTCPQSKQHRRRK